MGLLGFGGGKSSSESFGFSRSQDESRSGSIAGGSSISGGTSSSRDSIAFEDVFAKLFGGASGVASGLDPSLLTASANQLFSGGMNFLSSLSEGGAERAHLEDRISGQSPVLDEQIGALSADIGQFFREEINPAITADAVAGGTLGGGRQGVAQGQAAGAAGREFQRGVTALRSGDIAARDAAAGTLGAQRTQAAGVGLGSLSGVQGLAESGFGADLAPYAALAGILGGPTVLNQGASQQFASSEDFARAFSESFGFSESEQRSKSKAKNFGLDFG